jgi:hypothetical protein
MAENIQIKEIKTLLKTVMQMIQLELTCAYCNGVKIKKIPWNITEFKLISNNLLVESMKVILT